MPRKYTHEIHVQRLEKMLSSTDVCKKCPAGPHFVWKGGLGTMWSGDDSGPCAICMTFVGMSWTSIHCPCTTLGKEEAIRRSERAIKQFKERE